MKNLCLSIADAYTILRTPKEKPFAKCRYARASRSRKWDMRGGKTSASGIFFLCESWKQMRIRGFLRTIITNRVTLCVLIASRTMQVLLHIDADEIVLTP